MKATLFDGPRRIAAAVVVGLAGVVAWSAVAQGGIEPGETAERAVPHLERFAGAPRPLGSEANKDTEDYLVGQLREAGLDVEVQRAVGGRADGGLAAFGRVDNIVATVDGTDPTGTVVLAAHHDSAELAPGASDDGAAVAALLETVRTMDSRPRNDIVVLITDGEEDGLLGAEAFVREHPLGRDGGVVLNFEARGTSGASLMFETSRDNAGLVDLFTDTVPDPRGDSSMVEVYRILPNDTDFSVFSAAGFTGLNFAYIEGVSRYHTERDDLAHLDLGSLQHHADNMASLTRALGAVDLGTLDADHDDTYFRLLGITVGYPNVAVWPLAVLAVLAVGLLAWRRGVRAGPALVATGSAVLPLAAAFGLGQGFWVVLTWLRPEYATAGGFAHRPVAYHVAVILLGVLALAAWYLPLRRRLGEAALVVGGLAWPALLGVLCAAFAPGASFLFTLPALFAAVFLVASAPPLDAVFPPHVLGAGAPARDRQSRRRPLRSSRSFLPRLKSPLWRAVATGVGLAVGAALLPYFGYMTFVAIGLALAGVGALFTVLFGLVVLPVLGPLVPERRAVLVPAGALVASLALLGVGLAVDGRDAEHPAHTHLAYVLDAGTGRAHWVSAEPEPTDWTGRYVTSRETDGLPPGYQRGDVWTGEAPVLDLEGPDAEVLDRTGDTVTLRVASNRDALVLRVRVDAPVTEVTATIAGHDPVTVPVEGTRSGTWPVEIRLHDLPPEGAELTITGRATRVTVMDETVGLPDPVRRPPDLVAGIRDDADRVAVTRTLEL